MQRDGLQNNEIAYDATCNDMSLQRQSMFIVGNRMLCTQKPWQPT